MFHRSKSKHINFAGLLEAADSLVGRIPRVKKHRRIGRIYKILKYFCLSLVALFLIFLILFSAKVLSFKQFYQQAVSGQINLEQAIVFGGQNKFSQAETLARAAENNFDFLINNLSQIKNNQFINKFSFIASQLNGLESLLVGAKSLSKAVYGGADFGKSLENLISPLDSHDLTGQAGDKKLNFSKFSSEEKHRVLGKIFESAPELNGIKANLDLAYLNLEQVNLTGMFFPLREKIVQIKDQISEAKQILEKAVPLSQLLPALAGYPEPAKYLVLFEDNNELRPTGGALDAYGILQLEDGEITDFNTRDLYFLDAPAQGKIGVTAPEPIKKYLVDQPARGWYMRDANWSPDWPTAARKIDWFYQAESRLNPAAERISEFNGVIALTPKLITDFLSLTGPVTVSGLTINQTNFQDLFRDKAEPGNLVAGASALPRQEVIGEIIKELKIKIFDLPPADWPKVINALADNLARKNLLFYLADQQLENIAIANGWGGEIKAALGDYLMIVDANLGAKPTDAVINRNLEYKVTQGANGLFSKLVISYTHHGRLDQADGVYKSYTRIYVPLGSRLISTSGYQPEKIDTGNESGKTWFGFYFEVQPGEIKNLTIEYKLPAITSLPKNYELYIQKQPGKEINEAIVDLSFLNDIKSYSPASLSTQKVGSAELRWEGDLSIDRSFEVKF